jgi:hypothetical protein
MKEYLKMVLAGLLVLAMATPLFAADIKVTGQIRTRLRYWVDFDLDNDLKGGSQGSGSATTAGGGDRRYFDNRTRLGVEAKLGESVKAAIQLEKYWDFGNAQPQGTTSGSAGGVCCLGTPNDTEIEPYFRQAWMDFAIPGVEGWRFKAGRHFFGVGNGAVYGASLTGEDGFTVYGPLGPGNFKAHWGIPQNQGTAGLGATQGGQSGRNRFFDNEVHQWAVEYKFEVAEKQNLQLYFVGVNDRALTDYTTIIQPSGVLVAHGDDYTIGAAYNGVAGPVSLKMEGAYQFGPTRHGAAFDSATSTLCAGAKGTFPSTTVVNPITGLPASCTVESDIDRSAFLLMAAATYKVTPAYSVTLDVSYATGDDEPLDDSANNFVGPASHYTSSISRVLGESPFYFGNRTFRGIGNNTSNRLFSYWGRGTQDCDGNVGCASDDFGIPFSPGLIEVKVKNKWTPSKKWALFGDVLFLLADQTSGEITGVPIQASGSSYMGTEIDLKATYKPYPNITINNYLGYFISGDFFDRSDPLGAFPGTTFKNDDAWAYRVEAVVTF